MNLFEKKSALSAAGIKAAAKDLYKYRDHPKAAQIAVMAGLRHDTPQPIILDGRSPKVVPLGYKRGLNLRPFNRTQHIASSDVIWISGVAGSGKSELTHSMLRDCAKAGMRTVMVTSSPATADHWSGPATAPDWSDEDIKIFDLRNVTDEDFLIEEELLEALSDPSIIHILVVLPYTHNYRNYNLTIESLEEFIERFLCKADLKNAAIAIDEVVVKIQDLHPKSLKFLRNSCRISKNKLILVDNRMAEDFMSGKNDDIIKMKSIEAPSTPDQWDLCLLEPGEGFLVRGREDVPILGRYNDSDIGKPALTEDQLVLISKINTAMKFHPSETHVQRLELVSRCCGYRSWHAAQGMFANVMKSLRGQK